ncbi:MAG: hypothetical protein AB1401_13245 [Thermodesulfobacteriota bacterium]
MKDLFYAAGIILTFIIGIWNILMNYRQNRRTAFINTVTSERVKWIQTLRQNISAFCGLTYNWCYSNLPDKPEEVEVLKEIDKLRYLIRLQLNPDPESKSERKIEDLIKTIPELTDVSRRAELEDSLNELIKTTQLLLKEEWEKVKTESKRGDLKENENFLDLVNNFMLNFTAKKESPTGLGDINSKTT